MDESPPHIHLDDDGQEDKIMGSQADIAMVTLQDATKEVTSKKRRPSRDEVDGRKDKRKRPKLIENYPWAWVKQNGINCRECTQFIAKNTTTEDPECQCGYPISQHTAEAVGAAPTEGAVWNVKEHTRAVPTNAFGEMEFVNYGQKSARYIRVDTDTPPEKVWTLLTRVWKLKPPHLVISVTGGAKSFRLNPRLKEVFRKGLVKAAVSTDAWIISGGTNTGVMKYVGEAIRDLAMGQPSPIVALGIATWGCIMNKEALVKPKGMARYRMGQSHRGDEAPLDCNHSHIILVDNGTQHHYGVEIDFRAKLEKTIAEKSNAKGSVILVVVEGGPGTLETVYQSVSQQKIPALIIGGSGRAADILAYACDISEETILDETSHDGQTHKKLVKVLDDDALVKLQTRLEETFRGSKHNRILEYISWIKDCLLFPHLLSIFQVDRDHNAKDIDLAILKALLKANQEAAVDQLRLSLVWNRVDVAAADIYSEDKTFAEEDLNELMFTAIQRDRVDFVKMFLQGGLSLQDFLTDETLLKLYTTASRRSTLFWQLRKLKRKNKGLCSRGDSGEPEMDKLTLTDIGQLVEALMGSHFRTQYTEAYSISSVHMTGKRKFPAGDLFIWCILMARCDMAKVFWEEGKDSLAAALTGHALLKAMHRRTQDNELKQKLRQDALDFQQMAIGVLNTCYDDSDEKTARILLRMSEFWGQTSCINIAVGSKNKEFIAMKACQDLFKNIWWGQLEPSNGYSVLPSALFPPFAPFFLSYKRIKDESFDPSRTDGSLEEATAIVQNESVDIVPRTKSLNVGRKYVEFFKAPVTKFCYNAIAFVLLLLLYSYVMLIEFYPDRVRIPEMVLVVWVSSILCEELRQFWRASTGSFGSKVSHYFTDRWNILDMLTLILFYAGFVLRFFQQTFVAARLVLSINVFGFFVRLLHIFSISKLMGPKLVMISKMMWDLVSFMGILLVFIVGYAISSQSILYPNTVLQPSIIVDVFRKAYWQIFGELFLEEIEGQDIIDCVDGYRLSASGDTERCPTDIGKVAVPILLAFYMLITNVLLLNLLIAMFSNTFTMVQDQADLHWHFQLYKLTQEFENRPILPPPLIVLSHLYRIVRSCGKRAIGGPAGFLPDADDYSSEEERYLDIFEENRRDEYVFEQNKKTMDTTDFRVKSTVDKMDNLVLKVDDIQRSKPRPTSGVPNPDADYGQVNTSAREEMGSLKEQVGTLETQLAKTNEALEWIMLALRDSKITPGQAKGELLRMPSIKEEGDGKKLTFGKQKTKLSRQMSIDRQALVHTKSLCSPYPGTDVRRFPLAPEQMSWEVALPGYNPPFFTDQTVLDSPTWADEPSLKTEEVTWNKYDNTAEVNRSSYNGEYSVKSGIPLNPRGRTGLQGRGLLGRWGPNHAADPIVTRWKRGKGGGKVVEDGRPVLEYVATRRRDNKQFSFPGGLILPGETFDEAVRRNFVEEALSNLLEDEDMAARMEPILSKLFSDGVEVYTGYVDDSRNTDNAWIETRAVNYHDEDGALTSQLRLQPGKTEDGVAWLTVSSKMPLHANHIIILEKVAEMRNSDF